MKKTLIKLLLLTGTTLALLADSQSLYKNCSGCHGESGETSALKVSKVIVGQESNLTIKELTAYKNGELNQYGLGNIMKLQLRTVSEDDIAELAAYIEKMNPKASK